jgi:dipeptidyl aminopeptidase/acylaminoacyl peptidase
MRNFLILLLAACLASVPAAPKKKATSPKAAAPVKPNLTVDFIMRGPNLYGWEPQQVRWAGDNRRVFFSWKKWDDALEKDPDTYVSNGGTPRKLTEEEARLAPPASGEWNLYFSRRVYVQGGDLWLYDYPSDQARRLTKTADFEAQPRWLKDGKRVAFVRASNLYTLSLADGAIEQWTDIRTGPATDEEKKGTDAQEYLKKEEQALLEIVKKRAEKKKEADERKKRENPRKTFRLTAKQSIASLRLTPDEKFVLALVSETADGAKKAGVPNYITLDSYAEQMSTRTNVGDVQDKTRLAVIDVASGEVKFVDAGLKDRGLAWYSAVEFNETGDRALAVARATDNKDRWIFALDVPNAKVSTLWQEHDDAWVNIYGLFRFGFVTNTDVYYLSEKTGFSHLYRKPYAGGEGVALTTGRFEVQDVELSRDKQTFFLTTNEEHPGEQHFYAMPAAGGARTKLTSGVGKHEVTLSHDEKGLAVVHSYMNRPPELFLKNGSALQRITESPSPDFQAQRWTEPVLTTFKARDGADVWTRVYKPTGWVKGGPAVIFVHGAGYLQNAHKWWSQYSREYLFHHLLMERGYLVVDADYRASAGYGRDWRTGIYRFMGGKDLEDHVDLAKWIVTEHGVDAKRIGIYGGSYGGFITLMGMFTTPDVFAAGAALRPVTDWAHYNHGYTSNILNEPHKDSEAFKKSSPIYFAQNLKGALLICHGMVDVNVHYQDSVRLVQRLIELRKENWELASYPVEDHGFVQPTSWADEYKRILKLFETNLKTGATR